MMVTGKIAPYIRGHGAEYPPSPPLLIGKKITISQWLLSGRIWSLLKEPLVTSGGPIG